MTTPIETLEYDLSKVVETSPIEFATCPPTLLEGFTLVAPRHHDRAIELVTMLIERYDTDQSRVAKTSPIRVATHPHVPIKVFIALATYPCLVACDSHVIHVPTRFLLTLCITCPPNSLHVRPIATPATTINLVSRQHLTRC